MSFAQSQDARPFLTPEEMEWIANNPSIIASNNQSYAPIDFVSAGLPSGISIDYLNLLAGKVGLQISYAEDKPLNENLDMLRNNQIDLIHSVSVNRERSELFNFSKSYLNDSVVNYGRTSGPRIRSIDDLNGQKIGVIRGTILFDAYVENHPDLELVEVEDIPDALNALSDGRIDIFTAGEIVTRYLIQQTGIQGIEIVGRDFALDDQTSFEHRFATHNENTILQSIIDKGLETITSEESSQILRKWMGNDYAASNVGLTYEEKEWLSQNPIVRVGVNPALAPIEFINTNGEIDGIVGSYLERFSERLGVNFIWAENPTWNDAFTMVRAGQIDMFSNITPTAERSEYLSFTESFMSTSLMIFARDGGQFFGNMEGLTGRKIAQVKGFSTLEFIKNDYPNIEIIEVGSVIEALEMVSGGNADAHIGTIPATSYYIATEGITNIDISGETPYNGRNSMAVRSDLPLLASAMQKAMDSLTLQEKNEISRSWLALTIESKMDYTLLWYVIIIFVSIGGVILIWNRKLVLARQDAYKARKEAEAANEAKSRFLASMSHDLRTPLNAIIGFSEIIRKELHGPLSNERYKEYSVDIHSSGEYLLRLVNDILDVSRLESGEKTVHPIKIDFAEFADECKHLVRKLAKDKNITCNLNIDETAQYIYADEQALMQIMINILSNAIKFTHEGGLVEVKGVIDDGLYHITISDNGEGIEEDKIDKITEPFVRAGESAHVAQKEGTGLGLAIVKALVELHDGTLDIKSQFGQGTTVTVSLPLEPETA